MIFSSAAPLKRRLPAVWLAGFIVTALTGSGAALKLLSAEDSAGLLTRLSAALFIPSLALAAGIWSNGNKLFEVVYFTLWYLGPMNQVYAIDYPGANSSGNIGFFLPLTLALIVIAIIGRARQLQRRRGYAPTTAPAWAGAKVDPDGATRCMEHMSYMLC